MPYHPEAFTEVEECALALDGLSAGFGSMRWPQSAPPLREERAWLVLHHIPRWAYAAGQTAGWVWTGLGRAEPFDLIAPRSPGISPIARTLWKPRFGEVSGANLRRIGELLLTSRHLTAQDLLTCEGNDQTIAAQLYELLPDELSPIFSSESLSRSDKETLERARRRVELVRKWRGF